MGEIGMVSGWGLDRDGFEELQMTRIYIDIDGVLLTKRNPRPAEGAADFITFIIHHFECFWLTTHCKGSSQTALNYLRPYFSQETIQLLHGCKPTNWDTLKTEAIDFEADFYWLEDSPMNAEIEKLKSNGKLDRLIMVDLSWQGELAAIKGMLQGRLSFRNPP